MAILEVEKKLKVTYFRIFLRGKMVINLKRNNFLLFFYKSILNIDSRDIVNIYSFFPSKPLCGFLGYLGITVEKTLVSICFTLMNHM